VFFGEFEPFEGSALIDSGVGASIGMTANVLALGSVLIGPIWALMAAWRSTDESARRLALVAASALSGVGLVMVCGLVGVATDIGTIAVFCGMFTAVATVAAGCSHALATPSLSPAVLDGERPGESTVSAEAEGTPVTTGSGAVVDDAQARTDVTGSGLVGLTDREKEVLELLAEGFSNAGIAARLFISERTVDAHLRAVFTKLDLPDTRYDNRRIHAARAWRTAGEGVRESK
jgi:DNA-binding CsgD family transcriptional regulator